MATTARRLFALAVTFAAVAVGTIAAPAAADAGVTRYVDDDGQAAKAGCDGTRTVPSSIQAAIDASAPTDTIVVCPGRYAEAIDVDVPDLTIRGASRWTATLNPTTSGTGAIVRVSADDVRIQWLKVLGRTTGTCTLFSAGIQVNGVDGATIISNHVIASTKGDARFGPCGISTGIHVATGGEALVRYNLVRDFRLQGVWLQSADAGTAVKDNSVRFWHPDTVCAASASLCAAGKEPAIGSAPIGIHVHNTPAVVTTNAISATPDGSIATQLYAGIRVNSTSGATVRGNLIRRVSTFGIELNGATTSRIAANDIAEGLGSGIVAQGASTGNTIRANEIHGLGNAGIRLLAAATGNTLIGNDARGNAGTDCMDDPEGSTWTGNLGDESSPVGICTPAV
jgi:parallel beta-helix repeat protein